MFEEKEQIIILLFMVFVIVLKMYWEARVMKKISQVENLPISEERKRNKITQIKTKFRRRLKYYVLFVGMIFFILLSILSK